MYGSARLGTINRNEQLHMHGIVTGYNWLNPTPTTQEAFEIAIAEDPSLALPLYFVEAHEKLSAEPVYDPKTETYAYKAEEVPEEERLTEEKYRAVYPKGEEEEDEDDDEVEPDPADPIGPTPIDPWPVFPDFGNTMVKEKYAIFGIVRGYKQYELSNHLGNVLTTISDKKGYNLQSDYYVAEILSAQDYYPGGMLQPGRQYNPDSYRYGAGTQEMVNEVKGVGNHYTAQYWEMDPRLNRRWNTDPIVKFHESPYATFANNPIWFVDPNGADSLIVHRSSGVEKNGVIFYTLTFSIVRSGDIEILPYKLQQATNKSQKVNHKEIKLIQIPQNTDVTLEWQQMGKNKGKKGYENTIRVNIPFTKSDGSEYAVFMHPTSYSAFWLAGCCATAEELDDTGSPKGSTKEERFDASVRALSLIRDLYNLTESNKILNDKIGFLMRTDSDASNSQESESNGNNQTDENPVGN
ncbi:MAG: hypothetical protein ACXITV_12210 [Luteibaculaceae bacterium]